MDWANLLQVIYRCLLALLTIYYLYKKEYKVMRAVFLNLMLSFVPLLLSRLFHIDIDLFSIWAYYIVTIMSLYLGSSLGFYDQYRWWDRTIHAFSGIAFVGFGLAIADRGSESTKWLLLLFSFTFSITIHAFWEMLEYITDSVTHSDGQRWQKIHKSRNHVSPKAMQPAGLVDTMNDIICCMIGSAAAVIVWEMIL